MYAIIASGGKQYRVEKGDEIEVELIEPESDGKVNFNHVLLVNTGSATKIGLPHLGGISVLAELVQEVKGPKVIAFKYKRRKGIRSKKGHRQRYSRVKILEITGV